MTVPSELVGTGALWAILLAATVIASVQRPNPDCLAAAVPPLLITLALQVLHFAEEYTTGFATRFPVLLDLDSWSNDFFVIFNMTWICIWLAAAVVSLWRWQFLPAAIAIWFLALAAVANGIGHPLEALIAGGYFPGLITSPFLGLSGLILIRALKRPSAHATVGKRGQALGGEGVTADSDGSSLS